MPVVGRFRYLEALPRDVPPSAIGSGGGAGQLHGTLLLIHGFPLTARMWEPQLELAEHGWRVIAPHYRGMDGPAVETWRRRSMSTLETSSTCSMRCTSNRR